MGTSDQQERGTGDEEQEAGQSGEHRPASPPEASTEAGSVQVDTMSLSQAGRLEAGFESQPELESGTSPLEEDGGDERTFGVVGIGASAGGLESLMQLLQSLSPSTGMAFVIVQHLDPHHESEMAAILSKSTAMPVVPVEHNALLEPDHVYVMPPNATVLLVAGRLMLEPRPVRGQSMPIDLFLRSLAMERRGRAIGIILSGTGSDGALGVTAIKAEGGIGIAESDVTAKQNAMPRSAIGTGSIDFVLPAGDIGQKLGALAPRMQLAYSRAELEAGLGGTRDLRRILALLRTAKGVDFSLYRYTTIRRRIIRRMLVHNLHAVNEYVKLLREQPGELQALYDDVLIRVTSFFRDPMVHEALKEHVFAALLRDRGQDQPIRVWVPGCASGEEPYSIAMGLVEVMAQHKASLPVQIFATDVSEAALERARAGVYIENIALDVTPDRLRRFFSRSGKSYQISKSIRDMCVFARQDMTSDPPFSRLDLISCRNVLIYIEPPLQKRVLGIFHYALKPGGYLVLGHSESTSNSSELFKVVDRRNKIFARSASPHRPHLDVPAKVNAIAAPAVTRPHVVRPMLEEPGLQAAQREADRIVMARYAPAGVIIDPELHILQFRGQTGTYLEPAPGEPSFNLLKMARSPLTMELRTAVHKAQKSGEPVRTGPHDIRANGASHNVMVEVLPLRASPRDERSGAGCQHYLILFEDHRPEPMQPGDGDGAQGAQGAQKSAAALPVTPAERQEVTKLKHELAATREHMQSIIEELESVNEELQSANEEILSSNEELQSINEELETAKEELQSTNEELTTVNEELRTRNLELSQLNNDLNNSLSSVNLPIVMLSTDLRIRRFTPAAEKLLNLIPSDVGRPIGDIRPKIQADDLEERMAEVIDTMRIFETEVRDRDGCWYSMRIRPYRTADNKIDGAVLTLVDIDASKRVLEELKGVHQYANALLAVAHEPMVVLDGALRIRNANGAFFEFFRTTPETTEGRFLYDLGNGQWNIHSLRVLLEEILPQKSVLRDYRVDHDFPDIGPKSMSLNASLIPRSSGSPAECILLAFRDLTGRA